MSEEEQAIRELKSMSREELDLVPFDLVKWQCSGKGCTNGTKVRDYGIDPEYYHPGKGHQKFINVTGLINGYIWNCSKHWKLHKRLKKAGYPGEQIYRHLFDCEKPRIIR